MLDALDTFGDFIHAQGWTALGVIVGLFAAGLVLRALFVAGRVARDARRRDADLH